MKVLSKPQSQLREDCHQWTKIIWRENLLRFMALQRESIITTFLLRINRIWYMNAGIWPWHYSGFLSRICCFEWIVLLTIYIGTYLTEVLRCSTIRLSCFLSQDFVLSLVETDYQNLWMGWMSQICVSCCNFWANYTNTYVHVYH